MIQVARYTQPISNGTEGVRSPGTDIHITKWDCTSETSVRSTSNMLPFHDRQKNTESCVSCWRSYEETHRVRSPGGTTGRPSGDDPGCIGIGRESLQFQDTASQSTDVDSQSGPSGSPGPGCQGPETSRLRILSSVGSNSVMGLDWSTLEGDLIFISQRFGWIVDHVVSLQHSEGSGIRTDVATHLGGQTSAKNEMAFSVFWAFWNSSSPFLNYAVYSR